MTDDQVGILAADAFEAGAMELIRRGSPDASSRACRIDEECDPGVDPSIDGAGIPE
jgi:hypothetical protein